MKDYITVAGFPEYLINRDGLIYDTTAKKHVIREFRKNGYVYVTLRLNTLTTTCLVHRLVALSFIPMLNFKKFLVNHIDGNKHNPSANNLEWCDYKENHEHAGSIGLTEKCHPVSVRCTKTLIVTEYPSAQEAGRQLGISKDTVLWRLKTNGQKTWPDHKQYKLHKSTTPWGDVDSDPGFGRNRQITVRSLLTGVEKKFENQNMVAEFFGISVSSLSILLSNGQPVFSGGWQAKYNDVTEWTHVPDFYLELERLTNTKCCVMWTDTIIRIYESCIKCALANGLNATTLNYRLKSAGKTVFPDGFRYAYYSDFKQGLS